MATTRTDEAAAANEALEAAILAHEAACMAYEETRRAYEEACREQRRAKGTAGIARMLASRDLGGGAYEAARAAYEEAVSACQQARAAYEAACAAKRRAKSALGSAKMIAFRAPAQARREVQEEENAAYQRRKLVREAVRRHDQAGDREPLITTLASETGLTPDQVTTAWRELQAEWAAADAASLARCSPSPVASPSSAGLT